MPSCRRDAELSHQPELICDPPDFLDLAFPDHKDVYLAERNVTPGRLNPAPGSGVSAPERDLGDDAIAFCDEVAFHLGAEVCERLSHAADGGLQAGEPLRTSGRERREDLPVLDHNLVCDIEVAPIEDLVEQPPHYRLIGLNAQRSFSSSLSAASSETRW